MFYRKNLSFYLLRKPTGKKFTTAAREIGISHITLARLERGVYPASERTLKLAQEYYNIRCGKLLYLLDQLAIEGIRMRPRDIILPLPDELKEIFYKKHPLFKGR